MSDQSNFPEQEPADPWDQSVEGERAKPMSQDELEDFNRLVGNLEPVEQ